MNLPSTVWCGLAAGLILTLAPLQAADPYADALKAGDAEAGSGALDAAAEQYDTAAGLAQTPTQRALALGKKAVILTRKQDYTSARDAADEALNISGSIEPVGRIEALQALATCQIKNESDFRGALVTLDQAAELKGVDWSLPTTAMLRGDALRMSGEFGDAIACYESITAIPDVTPGIKAVAWLNIGLAQQYGLRSPEKAREAYEKAVGLNPELKAEVDQHTASLR